MRRDVSYLKEMIAHIMGLIGLLWIMAHLVLIGGWGEVVITERLQWVLYVELAFTGLVVILVAERLVSHSKGFLMSDLAIGREVLEMAIETEKSGHTFYQTMSALARNEEVRERFAQLAAAERLHQSTFVAMKSRLDKGKSEQKQPVEDDQNTYIHDLGKSGIFTGERALANKEISSDLEAVDLGIALEKECLLLYAEMRGRIPKRTMKAVEMVIDQEKRHLNQLYSMRNNLAVPTASLLT